MPRVKKYIAVCIQGRVETLTMTRFRKCYPGLQKKSPGQPAHTRATDRATPKFLRFGDSLQPFTCNEYLAYKHKNHVMKTIYRCVLGLST